MLASPSAPTTAQSRYRDAPPSLVRQGGMGLWVELGASDAHQQHAPRC